MMARTLREQEQPHPTGVTAAGKRLACEDIRVAIIELRYITDPRYAGCVANIRDRLNMALQWLGCEAESTESTLPGSGATRSVSPGECHAFRDTLKKLSFVDRPKWMTRDQDWYVFRDCPGRFFIGADDATADRLWDLIKPRE